MLVVSYDISNDKLRTKFAKTLEKQGAVRLQYSVYEINNTKRVLDNLVVRIEKYYSKKFDGGDSVFIFETDCKTALKYGNAIHRDQDIVYF
jgi:CRISPR-associated protein Cas2